jgi:hypothetical protein
MSFRNYCSTAFAVFALAGLLISPSVGAAAEPPEEGWEWAVEPYFWLPAVHGGHRVRGVNTHLDFDYGDMWDDLDFSGFMRIDGDNRSGAMGVWLDGGYLKFFDNPHSASTNDNVNFRTAIVDGGLTYAFIRDRLDHPGAKYQDHDGRYFRLSGLIGARYWYQKSSINPDGISKVSISKDWVDAIVGLDMAWDMTDMITLDIRGDIGGFGWGSSSDLASKSEAVFDIGFTDSFSMLAGYRYMTLDYGDGSFKLNQHLKFYGPIIGMSFKF